MALNAMVLPSALLRSLSVLKEEENTCVNGKTEPIRQTPEWLPDPTGELPRIPSGPDSRGWRFWLLCELHGSAAERSLHRWSREPPEILHSLLIRLLQILNKMCLSKTYRLNEGGCYAVARCNKCILALFLSGDEISGFSAPSIHRTERHHKFFM